MNMGDKPKYGTPIAPGIYAPNHQHFFVCRMHTAVDSTPGHTANSVWELNVETEPPGEQNPHGNAFAVTETLLDQEAVAARDCCPASARHWEIRSKKVNRAGVPTSFHLVPHGNVKPLALPEADFLRRAKFLEHHLWVTQFDVNERYPAGDYPNQNPNIGPGLPTWTRERNASLVDGNLVLWYVFGVTHIPRAEDWPVMPTEYTGFHLKPFNFFDRSPAVTSEPTRMILPEKQDDDGKPRSKL